MARRRNAPPALPSPASSVLARPAPAPAPAPVQPRAPAPRPSTLQGEVVREVVRPVSPPMPPPAPAPPKALAPAPAPAKASPARSTGRMLGMAGMFGALGLLIYYATTRAQRSSRSFIPATLPRLTPMQSIERAGALMQRDLLNIKRLPPDFNLVERINRGRS